MKWSKADRYMELARVTIDRLGMDRVKLAPVQALAHLRNAMHNNGVHNKDNYRYEIKSAIPRSGHAAVEISGQPLVFERDKKVPLHPLHVLALCTDVVGVVRDVIANPAISAVPGPILDNFAEQNSNA
jgi:hypothetical protein